MLLRAGYIAVAQKLQEAVSTMCTGDVWTRLNDAISDAFRGTGNWAYIVAVFGDDSSGDVVYSVNSDLKKASYTVSRSSCTIDTKGAVDVLPFTTYEVQATDFSEAGARNSKRDLRQLQTIHDSAAALGANCTMAEAHRDVPRETPGLSLLEGVSTVDQIVLKEARADYEIKLIAPGKGSSAFYPAEVLKRDGPSVFKEGTHVYLNHPTAAEESQRPEGDVKNLAGVLTTTATYHESHAKGPGLYARMKVFADHGQLVEEKAAHVGMSIRASGVAESGKLRDGVPILKQLTGAESVDVVTRAGAGGMILTEAALPPNPTQEAAMDAAEINKLVEAGVKAGTSSLVTAQTALLERAIRGDAREEATRILKAVTLPELGKERVIEAALRVIPKTEAGELDRVKFTESVNLEAKREGAYIAELTNAGRVVGMGATVVTPTPEQEKQHRESAVATRKDAVNVFESIMGGGAAAKAAASHYGEEAA